MERHASIAAELQQQPQRLRLSAAVRRDALADRQTDVGGQAFERAYDALEARYQEAADNVETCRDIAADAQAMSTEQGRRDAGKLEKFRRMAWTHRFDQIALTG